MLKFTLATIAAAVIMFATQATSEAAGRGRCATAAPVYQTAPVYQAAAPTGYRTFSYQPSTVEYRGSMMRSSSSRPSYLDAGSKAIGRFGK
jgi:hypothetical protein